MGWMSVVQVVCSEINYASRLRGDAQFIDIACAEDFTIAFDVESKKRKCAAADIVAKRGSTVWGALYTVPDYLVDRETAKASDRKSFDEIEGEDTNYIRKTISVRLPSGKIVFALTYVVKSPQMGLKTNIEYVGSLFEGYVIATFLKATLHR
jgi:gamma-glutamylcyclotransferase (GGCT)/AIG2-like uncharacterized protein YtfP